jgi:hypothetical protein
MLKGLQFLAHGAITAPIWVDLHFDAAADATSDIVVLLFSRLDGVAFLTEDMRKGLHSKNLTN